ncbi:MAG: cation:proton antiporter, partial [Endomicrobia bacterium]|nr:cation:proton antiporter [Endomicrobiia bacterium]
MEYQLLQIMAIGFALALAFGYITHKLGLSSMVGYLVAGFLIGPLTPGFVADYGLAHQLSEVGVILLMFGVGLHFKLDDLIAVKGIAIPGAIAQSTAATVCGIFAGTAL